MNNKDPGPNDMIDESMSNIDMCVEVRQMLSKLLPEEQEKMHFFINGYSFEDMSVFYEKPASELKMDFIEIFLKLQGDINAMFWGDFFNYLFSSGEDHAEGLDLSKYINTMDMLN